jgi:hypothetical protein
MAAYDPVDLAPVCEAYLDEQYRLLTMLQQGGNPVNVGLAMKANLDRFAAAVRQAQPEGARVRRPEPGS